MPLIRDTIDPLRERAVSDEEALDLERQNVLLTGTRAKTPEGLRAAAVRQSLQNVADAFAAEPHPTRPASAPVVDDQDDDQDNHDGNVEDENDPASNDNPQES